MKVELILYLDEEHKSIGTYDLEAMNYELNHSFLILYFSEGEVWLLPISRIHNAYFWPEGVEPRKPPQPSAEGAAEKKKQKQKRVMPTNIKKKKEVKNGK